MVKGFGSGIEVLVFRVQVSCKVEIELTNVYIEFHLSLRAS